MGIEEVLSKLGGQAGEQAGLSQIMKLFGGGGGGQGNGLQGLMSGLTSNGLGEQLQSWIGQGKNEQITATDVQQHVDPQTLNQVAEQAHMTPEQVSQSVAEVLPDMVNQMTPQGQVPAEDPMAKGMSSLQQMFKSGQ
jgi:uncharacterized protein YidB (DUF937 family)